MLSMWVGRIYQIHGQHGQHVANQWAKKMFNAEQMVLINREIVNRKGKKD
jgi:hypothetical protein